MAYPTTVNNQSTSWAPAQTITSANANGVGVDVNALTVKVGSGATTPVAGGVLAGGVTGTSVWVASQVFSAAAYGASAAASAVNNTTAIQAAITAATASPYGIVELPPGNLQVTPAAGSLVFALASNMWFRGSGVGRTTLTLANGAAARVIYANTLTDVRVSDLTIDGNRANCPSGLFGVHLASPTRGLVERVRVTGTKREGIVVDGSPVDSIIRDCHVTDTDGFGGISVTNNVRVLACTVRDIISSPHIQVADNCVVENCVLVRSSGTGTAVLVTGEHTLVKGNRCEWVGAGGAAIATSYNKSYIEITNNIVRGGGAGIHLGGSGGSAACTASHCVISDNIIQGDAAFSMGDGILLGGTANISTGADNVVTGNVVSDIVGNGTGGQYGGGIESQLARTVISGNTATGCSDHGIFCNSDWAIISGNVSKGNGTVFDAAGIKAPGSNQQITDNVCLDNGSAGSVGIGILIGNDSVSPTVAITGTRVSGNLCGDTRAGAARTQDYGIQLGIAFASTITNLTITDNVVRNNAVSQIALAGTGHIVRGNTGDTPIAVTGSRGANAALASLLTQLAALGLITDSTT